MTVWRSVLLLAAGAAAGAAAGNQAPETGYAPDLRLAVAPQTPCPRVDRPDDFRSAVYRALPSVPGYDRDHRVPWEEALESGLCARPEADRLAFYKDTGNLWPIPASVNRSKGDRDIAGWTPLCWYARRIVETKRKHALTADRAEVKALRAALAECPPEAGR